MLTLEADDNAVLVVATELVDAVPGLLVAQATHLSSFDLLLIGHSHDPATGLNCVSSDDCKVNTEQQ